MAMLSCVLRQMLLCRQFYAVLTHSGTLGQTLEKLTLDLQCNQHNNKQSPFLPAATEMVSPVAQISAKSNEISQAGTILMLGITG